MIVLSNSALQTIAPGQTVNFDVVSLHTGNAEFHRNGFPSIKLRCKGIYEVNFSANITNESTGSVQLAIALDGTPIPQSVMISTPDTAGDTNNIAKTILVQNCCGCAQLTVTNNGTTTVTLEPNSVFYVARKA